jgi:hypothetical protein
VTCEVGRQRMPCRNSVCWALARGVCVVVERCTVICVCWLCSCRYEEVRIFTIKSGRPGPPRGGSGCEKTCRVVSHTDAVPHRRRIKQSRPSTRCSPVEQLTCCRRSQTARAEHNHSAVRLGRHVPLAKNINGSQAGWKRKYGLEEAESCREGMAG